MEKKYELTNETMEWKGHTLYRIRALREIQILFFGQITVKAGELGGWVEKESNLSQRGNCWIFADLFEGKKRVKAKVYGNARVCDNAIVRGDSTICNNAVLLDTSAVVHSIICDNAIAEGNSFITDYSTIGKNGRVSYDVTVTSSIVYGTASDSATICAESIIEEGATVCGDALIQNSEITSGMFVNGKEEYIGGSLVKLF